MRENLQFEKMHAFTEAKKQGTDDAMLQVKHNAYVCKVKCVPAILRKDVRQCAATQWTMRTNNGVTTLLNSG